MINTYYKPIEEISSDNSPIPYHILYQLEIDKISGISWQTDDDEISNITIIFKKVDNELIENVSNLIIKKLGNNHTDSIRFTKKESKSNVNGLYTYRGDVYCLLFGTDMHLSELDKKDIIEIKNMFINNDWVIDNTL